MIIKSDDQYWQYVRIIDDLLDIMGEDEGHYLAEATRIVSQAVIQYDETKEAQIKRRVKLGSKFTSLDVQKAADAGNKVFEYYCEHGKLPPEVIK